MPDPAPLLYNVREVARLLGRTPRATRRLIQKGLIPARRLGVRYVVLPDELKAHLKSLRKPGEEQ
jgi:excisionase family DNA binding protein